jgi:regulator of protease activity HflC (stomatin/prohibitin superfamily)
VEHLPDDLGLQGVPAEDPAREISGKLHDGPLPDPEAEADAAVARIEADAKAYAIEKEAEANERLAKSLTDNLIEYMKVNQWDGSLPMITGGTTPILDMTDLTGAAE